MAAAMKIQAQACLMMECVGNMAKTLTKPDASAQTIRRHAQLLYAIEWPRMLVTEAVSGALGEMFRKLRAPKLRKKNYIGLKRANATVLTDSSQIFPTQWEFWRAALARYGVAEILPIPDWLGGNRDVGYIPPWGARKTCDCLPTRRFCNIRQDTAKGQNGTPLANLRMILRNGPEYRQNALTSSR